MAPRESGNGKQNSAEQSAERKRAARVPADSAVGLPRYDLTKVEPPVAEIVIQGAEGARRVVPVHRLSVGVIREIELREREKRENPDDAEMDRLLVDAYEQAVVECAHGVTREEVKRLTAQQIGRIMAIALERDSDTPLAEVPAAPAPRKARR